VGAGGQGAGFQLAGNKLRDAGCRVKVDSLHCGGWQFHSSSKKAISQAALLALILGEDLKWLFSGSGSNPWRVS